MSRRRASKADRDMRTRMAQALAVGGGHAISLLESVDNPGEFDRRNRLLWDCLQYRYHADRQGQLRQRTMIGVPIVVTPEGPDQTELPDRFPALARTVGNSLHKTGVLAESARRPRMFEQLVLASELIDGSDIDALHQLIDRVGPGRDTVIPDAFPLFEPGGPIIDRDPAGVDPFAWLLVGLVDHAAKESWRWVRRGATARWDTWLDKIQRQVECELEKAGIKSRILVSRPAPVVEAAASAIDNRNRLRVMYSMTHMLNTYGREGIVVGVEADTVGCASYRVAFINAKTDEELYALWWECLPGEPVPDDQGAYRLCEQLALDSLVPSHWIYSAGDRLQ